MGQLQLDWRLHELVRMRVATINECTVCLGWRTPMAVEAGVTDEDCSPRVTTSVRSPLLRGRARRARVHEHFCTDRARIDDDLSTRLGEQFDAGETVELTLVIAKYLAMGRFMQVLGLDQSCSLQMTTAGDVVATT